MAQKQFSHNARDKTDGKQSDCKYVSERAHVSPVRIHLGYGARTARSHYEGEVIIAAIIGMLHVGAIPFHTLNTFVAVDIHDYVLMGW